MKIKYVCTREPVNHGWSMTQSIRAADSEIALANGFVTARSTRGKPQTTVIPLSNILYFVLDEEIKNESERPAEAGSKSSAEGQTSKDNKGVSPSRTK